MLRNIKGYKPPAIPVGEEGSAPAHEVKVVREALLPEFENGVAEMITKDEADQFR